MSHPDAFAALVVAALWGGTALLLQITKHLADIASELKRAREDNAAWRENLWNRDADRR